MSEYIYADGIFKLKSSFSAKSYLSEAEKVTGVLSDFEGRHYLLIKDRNNIKILSIDTDERISAEMIVENISDMCRHYIAGDGKILIEELQPDTNGTFDIDYEQKVSINELRLVDITTGNTEWNIKDNINIKNVLSANEQYIYCLGREDEIYVLAADTGEQVKIYSGYNTGLFDNIDYVYDRNDYKAYSIGSSLYILRKSDIYVIDIEKEELLQKNMAAKSTFFSDKYVAADGFVVSDDNTFYIIGYSGGECTDKFYVIENKIK